MTGTEKSLPIVSAPPSLRAPHFCAAPTPPSTEHDSDAFFDAEMEGQLDCRYTETQSSA